MINIPDKNTLHKLIIFFSIIILLGFAAILFLIANDRISEYHKSQKLIAKQATESVSAAVERVLSQERILVSSFINDNQELFDQIVKSPENDSIKANLNRKLSKYFFNYYSSNIATMDGDLLIHDFDGDVGELCLQDMDEFRRKKVYQTSLHPGPVRYHYDIVAEFNSHNNPYLLLASFNFDVLTNILKLSNPVNHNLHLVKVENNYLIEINTSGVRKNIPNRLDYHFTEQEKSKILSSSPIKGTKWHVVDLHNDTLFTDYKKDVRTRIYIIYTFGFLMTIIFSSLLISQVKKNQRFADSMIEKNMKIEDLNNKLNEMNEILSQQSITDGLTGIYNRRHFDVEILNEWNKATRLGLPINIALIDIDYFKQYNDTYGHQAGDDCLKKVANIINSTYKRTNEFFARYGGEEFILLNLGSKPEIFQSNLEGTIVTIRENKIEHKGSKIKPYLTVSIGSASTTDTTKTTYTELIDSADKALYKAKEQGRDQLVTSNLT